MMLEGAIPFPKQLVEQYYKKRWWSGISIGEMLDRSCDLYAHKEALVAGKVRLTYSELRELANKAAIAFVEVGIRKLDRVLLQLPNWPEFVYAYYGLHKIGAIPVMFRPRFSEWEVEHFSALTEAKAWIVPLRYEKIDSVQLIGHVRSARPSLENILVTSVTKKVGSLPEGTISFNSLLEQVDLSRHAQDYLDAFKPDPGEICHLMPTAGSTGLPKLVPRTHNDFLCNVEYRAKAWERGPRDITLIATPLSHNMAIEVSMNPAFLTGGKLVLNSSTESKEILEAIQKEKVTTMILAVAQLQQLVDDPELDRYDVSSLQVIAAAGSHVPSELIRKVHKKLRCRFLNVYGMSEGPCTQTRYDDPDEVVLHTVGRPVCPYDEFKVIDGQGKETPLGEEGELVARGPCVFRGYYKAEADNRQAFTSDGFFRTGDLAKFDSEGRIVITGRRKDIIIRGGVNISASEVEERIGGHPEVQQVAVVGMPDPMLGERICAFIKLRKGAVLSFEELISYLKGKKTSVLNLPERVEFIDAIPLTSVGKIDKRQLRETIKARLEEEAKLRERISA